jgi:hypothetical protein
MGVENLRPSRPIAHRARRAFASALDTREVRFHSCKQRISKVHPFTFLCGAFPLAYGIGVFTLLDPYSETAGSARAYHDEEQTSLVPCMSGTS